MMENTGMRFFDGFKVVYCNNADTLLKGFVGEASPENIAKLSARFRLAPDIVRRGLAARPANYAALLPMKRAAPAQAALRAADVSSVTRAQTIEQVRRDLAREDVATSWKQTHGRCSE
jgi:hypothetical protein